ncbi:MAG TPA: methyl-accepting chemotaxis protein [Syntrophomonadaceae bacterium]|nr:methyl-accepting chemotaxis protein [Syntrophomonadaceae bacterium]
MAKKLAQPNSSTAMDRTGIIAKRENDDVVLKREHAKKIAQEKTRARTMAKQQGMAERIASASEQLVAGVEESTSSSQEFSRLMDEVSGAADQAAMNSDEMRTASVQMNSAAMDVDTVMDNLIAAGNLSIKAAGESIQTTENMTNLTKIAATKNQQSAKRIGELEVQSQRIGDIVQAVVMIADQTNLLALNAAIEAARAGEHGRGFAVVADEVRNLAEISERSARDIRGVVDEIRAGVTDVVKDINETVENYNSLAVGMEETVQGFSSLEELVGQYGDSNMLVKEVARRIAGQGQKLLAGSESIASATEEAAGGTKEINKAVVEQSKALAEVNTASQELSEMAEDLKTSTNISKSAEEVAATAEQLSANIEELSSSATQIASGIMQMTEAIRVVNQEAKVGEELLALSLKDYDDLTEKAKVSGKLRVESLDLLAATRKKAAEINARIHESTKSYETTNNELEKLQDKIRRIEKIVDTIQNVSIQTNMLAVNGFVEAATAGEHGRGFSVVAGDIRNLATESAENADKIKDLVREIQNQMSKVLTDINQSETAAREADAYGPVSVQKNSAITAQMEETASIGKGYWVAAEALKGAIDVNNQQVSELAVVVEKVNNEVQEASRVGQEQAKAIDELASSIEEIASIADEMQMG